MSTSAHDRSLDERRLSNAVSLYRDLSEALTERLTAIRRQGPVVTDEAKGVDDVAKRHQGALQTVLDLEARLGRRNGTDAGGGAVELDLAGARAEILARLARWNAEGGA